MNLNSVNVFGKMMSGNGAVAQGFLIFFVVLLGIMLIALILQLLNMLTKPEEEAQTLEVQEEAAVTYVEAPATPQPEKVVVVQQAAPQPQPQVIIIQQPAPASTPVAASEDEDYDDEEELEEESFEGGTVRYNRSFLAKYIQSSDETKDYYVHLKNELLSYKKVRARTSWKRETFSLGRNPVARLIFRGKTLCICLPLDPAKFAESKYHVEDVSNVTMYEDTPCMYRIRNERRLKYAYELLEMVTQELGTTKMPNHLSEDYYLPYEGVVQLIDKGLIKRIIRYNNKDFPKS